MTHPSASSSSNPLRNEPYQSSSSGVGSVGGGSVGGGVSGVHGSSNSSSSISSVAGVSSAINNNHHPGTSGRSPPPPHSSSSSLGGRGGGGRLSVESAFHTSASGASIPAAAATTSTTATGSYGSGSTRLPPGAMMIGTRLSYGGGGGASASVGPSAADDAAGMIPTTTTRTPAQYHYYQQQQLRQQQQQQHQQQSHLPSPPSTTSTQNTATDNMDNAHYTQSDFLAALSPSTANFLRRGRRRGVVGSGSGGHDGDDNGDGEDDMHPDTIAIETTPTTTTALKCNNNHVLSPSSAASLAAENAVRTAANAARGIENATSNNNSAAAANADQPRPADIDMMENDNDDDDDARKRNNLNNDNDKDMNHANNNNSMDKDGTSQLRQFVQSLLGMQLPASLSPSLSAAGGGGASNSSSTMITPDPTSAAFFAISLLTKTAYSLTTSSSSSSSSSTNINNNVDASVGGKGRQMAGHHGDGSSFKTKYWRPDDAYLAARALSLKGEDKRAIYILDKVGLIGFGVEGGGSGGGGDLGWELEEVEENDKGERQSEPTTRAATIPISNRRGVRNALLLRAESALLAGQCLVRAGEYDRASMVYEEAMRYPPPPPPSHWGMFGYGYRPDDIRRRQCGVGSYRVSNNVDENTEDDERREDEDFDALLADGTYLRSWREQSFSHTALIDDGNDVRLLQLAASILPLPFSKASKNDSSSIMAGGIHPMARLCAARGIAFDAMSNPHRAVTFFKAALTIDARCMEALDYVIKRRLLTPEEEREWISSLNFGAGDLSSMGLSWLRDAYLARLRGIGGVVAATNLYPTSQRDSTCKGSTEVSPVPRVDMLSPSVLSIGSPDFAAGAVMGGDRNQAPTDSFPPPNDLVALAGKTTSLSQTIDESFHNLAIVHDLGHSPDVLSHAAIRAYALHDLQSALAYCTAIDTIDPYCRTAGYVHVATLVGLNLKRRLFHLAHRLVDTDPKDALAWFAVGSYYYTCRRYDLAQRHFSRSTRLDPSSAECWIGFGCSFAVCDESDQALASFRAAQNNYAGSHVPLLYMGMEYLRTNHLSLAGHFLNAAQRTDPYDMLCCNELGVWSYRQGDLKDASFWFLKALRLQLKAEGSSSLNSIDEGLGMDGFILLTGKHAKKRAVADSDYYGVGTTVPNYSVDAITSVTPYLMRRSSIVEGPPVSTVLCAVKTPSGHSVAASLFSDIHVHRDTDFLSDMECVERCKDPFWEPTIFNLGQSFRKMKRYEDAIVCFQKCTSLNPGNYAAYAALGFAKHLGGDVDGAIDTYHKSLSRKPEDNFTSEMLTRALAEAVTYPPSVAMQVSSSRGDGRFVGVGSSILREAAYFADKDDDAMM